MLKPLTSRNTSNCGKCFNRWEYQTTLPASCETHMQVKKQQLETDKERRTGSKWERSISRWYIVTLLIKLKCRVQFSSAQSCPTLCDPMNRSMPSLPVHHQLLESTQSHVHQVGDAIQPSHPVIPFSSCPQPFKHQGFFQ